MFRFPGNQIECVRQQICYRFKRLDGTSRASWKIQNQTCSPHTAHGATENGIASLRESFRTHLLGDAVDQAIADRTRGLGRYIARRNTRPSGGHYQARGAA